MFLCTWLDNKLQRIKINNIKPNETVGHLKKMLLKVMDKNLQNSVFIYRGCILSDDMCLNDYEITENAVIHVTEKFSPDPSIKSAECSTEEDILNVVSSFRVLSQNPGFRSNVQRILRAGAMNDIFKAVLAMETDTTAVSLLLDAELVIHLADPDTVRLLGEKHPSVIRAAAILAKYMNDQSNSIHQQPTTSTGYSYSLDALSDDEDMDSNTESSRDSYPITRNSSVNIITSAQLAAAIANATNASFPTTSSEISGTAASTRNIITSDIFSSALQQAFGTTPAVTPAVTPDTEDESSISTLAVRYENELRQMHELGLINDRMNIRALQTTSGNLQEAVELVLYGVMD